MVMEEPAFITLPIEEYKAICDYSLKLDAHIKRLESQIMALEARQKALDESFLEFQDKIPRDIASDRRRIAALERQETKPTKGQKDRGEMLIALVMFNGGSMPAKEARLKMQMDKGNFNRLLSTMKDYIKVKKMNTDKRCKMLEYIG